MRYLLLAVALLLALPVQARAQHSPSLPSIGLPLPRIGLTPVWERPQSPWWERQAPPPWERNQLAVPAGQPKHRPDFDPRFDRRRRGPQVLYVMQPYPYPVEVAQPPQIIVVQPVTQIVQPPPQPEQPRTPALQVPLDTNPGPPPPYVPTGDRTLYIIPGCYVGNVPPAGVKLPPGCDPGKLTTYTP